MDIVLKQKTEQILSPQMIQSMQVLQMGTQELLEYIEETIEENPILDFDETQNQAEEYERFKREMNWLEDADIQNRYYSGDDAEESDALQRCGQAEDEEQTLFDAVLEQLQQRRLAPTLYKAAVFLAASLNAAGWLDETLTVLAAESGWTERVLMRALVLLQSLEPAGIGARSLEECLRIQLLRKKSRYQHTALLIVQNYLDALAKYHYGFIAKKIGCSIEEVKAACALIREMNPKPGAVYESAEKTVYIIPDLTAVEGENGIELIVNDKFLPHLRISGYYARMLQTEQGDAAVKAYLTDKVKQAKWVMQSVEQRRDTLLLCARCILEAQQSFFQSAQGRLSPLTMAEVANRLGIHESTVSRAVRNKYIQCARGVYPLSHFFSHTVGTSAESAEKISADDVKALIRTLIQNENKQKPLSDQKICEQMQRQGCCVSRRTVAKYREEMNIPNTTGRKNM